MSGHLAIIKNIQSPRRPYYQYTADGVPSYAVRRGRAAVMNEEVAKKVADQLDAITAHRHTVLRITEGGGSIE